MVRLARLALALGLLWGLPAFGQAIGPIPNGDIPATLAFPVTVTGGVSGAVPCFTSTTTLSAGTLLGANQVVVGGGAGVCPSSVSTLTVTSGVLNNSLSGAASVSAETMTGAIFTGGTGTTTVPLHLMQPSAVSAATNWNTAGTVFGINAPTGFTGNFIDFKIAGSTIYTASGSTFATSGILSAATQVKLSTTTGTFNINSDTFWVRDAANIWAQRNGATAQTLRVYGTFTDTSNGDWLSLAKAAGGTATISTVANGTGTAGPLALVAASASWSFSTGGTLSTPGAIVLASSTAYVWSGRSQLFSSADGQVTVRNQANSAFSFLQAKLETDTNYTGSAVVATGYLTVFDATGAAYKIPACLATGC